MRDYFSSTGEVMVAHAKRMIGEKRDERIQVTLGDKLNRARTRLSREEARMVPSSCLGSRWMTHLWLI